ncbi:hypothetical protein FSP39_025227 [Pinctada imbricata]|uniref:Uncharacterized protein n=1 Tax=Pinctada imbricata TaxID=66713 RepID=A0AA88YRR2_PINIB|nr:hypothetical protein FSP39_025227 [Pinctada imbricata]
MHKNTRANPSKTDAASPKSSKTKESEKTGLEENISIIKSDLKDMKETLVKTVKTEDVRVIVTEIVQQLLKENNKEIDKAIEKKVQEKCAELESKHKQTVNGLNEKIDGLALDVESLQEQLNECKKEMRGMHTKINENERHAAIAVSSSNYNEQYSRKTNIKIYGVKENQRENTNEVARENILKSAGVSVNEHDVVACHRIPGGRRDQPRPILLKLRNSECKAQVMRKRAQVKRSGTGIRLADDVTAANSALINKLHDHPDIDSAWYFNGSVYGQCGETCLKFDIIDDINSKICGKVRERRSEKSGHD